MELVFTKSAERDWRKLPAGTRKLLRKKLSFFVSAKNPLEFARPMRDSALGDYRFRIGHHRILFDVDDGVATVVRVGHRKDVYR